MRSDERILKSRAGAAARVMKDAEATAAVLGDRETKAAVKRVVKPNSVSTTLRKVGVALILAPDPITAVPGAVMLGASLATKDKRPLSAASVVDETRKLLDEIGSSIHPLSTNR